jgi:hypothetical protein
MKRSRKSSQELIKFYKGLDISYFDIENSNVRERSNDEIDNIKLYSMYT